MQLKIIISIAALVIVSDCSAEASRIENKASDNDLIVSLQDVEYVVENRDSGGFSFVGLKPYYVVTNQSGHSLCLRYPPIVSRYDHDGVDMGNGSSFPFSDDVKHLLVNPGESVRPVHEVYLTFDSYLDEHEFTKIEEVEAAFAQLHSVQVNFRFFTCDSSNGRFDTQERFLTIQRDKIPYSLSEVESNLWINQDM